MSHHTLINFINVGLKFVLKKKRIIFWILLCVMTYLSIELVSLTGLMILDTWKNTTYSPALVKLSEKDKKLIKLFINNGHPAKTLSPTLGWANKPNAHEVKYLEVINRSVKRTINSQGIRGHREYLSAPKNGVTRITAFGDSFTFGAEVNDEECWTELLNVADDKLEVLNFGIGGGSLDQGFLSYEEKGFTFQSDLVLIGFMTENINRQVNVFRTFLAKNGLPVAKPRYFLDGDDLKLLPNPLSSFAAYENLLNNEEDVLAKLGAHDFFYQQAYHEGNFDFFPSVRLYKILKHTIGKTLSSDYIFEAGQYNSKSEAFQITTKLFEKFYRRVLFDGAIPIILIFPTQSDIVDSRNGISVPYRPLLDWFLIRHFRYVDLRMAFEKFGQEYESQEFFSGLGHYSVLGNKIVARYLQEYLSENHLIEKQ